MACGDSLLRSLPATPQAKQSHIRSSCIFSHKLTVSPSSCNFSVSLDFTTVFTKLTVHSAYLVGHVSFSHFSLTVVEDPSSQRFNCRLIPQSKRNTRILPTRFDRVDTGQFLWSWLSTGPMSPIRQALQDL
jgi:hypothetical protein